MSDIKYFDSADAVANAAAARVVEICAAAIKANGRFTIALSGGNTPAALYSLLAAEPYCSQTDWSKFFVFWGDERCVPSESSDNNSHNAKKNLLNRVPVPAENVFPMHTELSPADAAAQYEKTLTDFFKEAIPKFDLILLGMGDNGHTASLFPHTAVLHEKESIVKEVYVAEVKMSRITFTVPLINHAAHILFLIAGKEKEPMFRTVTEGPFLPDQYPAQLIKNAQWFVYV